MNTEQFKKLLDAFGAACVIYEVCEGKDTKVCGQQLDATRAAVMAAFTAPADAVLVDWPQDSGDALEEFDAIYAEYATTFGKFPSIAMGDTLRRVRHRLFDWWAHHREAIRVGLVVSYAPPGCRVVGRIADDPELQAAVRKGLEDGTMSVS